MTSLIYPIGERIYKFALYVYDEIEGRFRSIRKDSPEYQKALKQHLVMERLMAEGKHLSKDVNIDSPNIGLNPHYQRYEATVQEAVQVCERCNLRLSEEEKEIRKRAKEAVEADLRQGNVADKIIKIVMIGGTVFMGVYTCFYLPSNIVRLTRILSKL